MALMSALLLHALPAQAAPAHALERTPEITDSGPLQREAPGDPATDHWHDTEALPGQRIFIPFEGGAAELGELRVDVPQAFPGFRAQVEPDNSIRVKVPQSFPGVTRATPMFTVSAGDREIDSFSVAVEYPRANAAEPEHSSRLVAMIAELVLRLPQLPWLARILG